MLVRIDVIVPEDKLTLVSLRHLPKGFAVDRGPRIDSENRLTTSIC